jgi:Na+/melibiose symporter-like transporter
MAGATLAIFGYQANVAQTDTALLGIKIAFAGSSIVGAALVILCLRYYRLTRGWQERLPPASA